MKIYSRNARTLTLLGVLGALSAILMLIEVPLPFAPSYMKIDFSDLPALFAGFFMGPFSALLVALLKIALRLILKGTETAFVGEFTNLLFTLAYVLPAAYIYRFWHTRRGALGSLLLATVISSLFAVLGNLYIALPLYVSLYKIPLSAIFSMTAAVNPWVYDMPSFLLFCVLPFNLVKYSLASTVTYLLYKRLSQAITRLLCESTSPAPRNEKELSTR